MVIVFFDGYCGLCSGVVDFLIERDTNRRLRFAPLQGTTALSKLKASDIQDLDTVIVVREVSASDLAEGSTSGTKTGTSFRKSTAIFEALKELGGGYALLARALAFFPQALRDAVYDLIAKNRFKIFGRRDYCRAPTKEERELFLP